MVACAYGLESPFCTLVVCIFGIIFIRCINEARGVPSPAAQICEAGNGWCLSSFAFLRFSCDLLAVVVHKESLNWISLAFPFT